MSYLPLAHILELSAEISCLSVGMRLGYGSPITLTTGGTGLVKGCEGDLVKLQPTSMWFPVNSVVIFENQYFNFVLLYFVHVINATNQNFKSDFTFLNAKLRGSY